MLKCINYGHLGRLISSVIEKEKEKKPEDNYYSFSEFKDNTHSIDDVKSKLGRKGNVNLGNLYRLSNYFRHHIKTEDGKYVGIGIPTTSESLREKLKIGTQQNFSKTIQRGIDADLLCCVDETYQFDAHNVEDNHSRKFIINDKVYEILKEWYDEQKKLGKIAETLEEVEEEELEDMTHKSPYTQEEINMFRITSTLHSPKTERNDDEIRELLRLHYPELRELQDIIAEENTNPFILSDYGNLQRKAIPSIHRDPRNFKLISGIGLRDSSALSSVEKSLRKHYLSNVLGKDYLEFDVCSSVYRVNYLLNNGVWLDNSVDLYEKIWEGPFIEIKRDNFKDLCQRIYFSQSIEKASVPFVNKGLDKEETIKTLKLIKDSMERVCGPLFGSEVFLYESRLYAEFALTLMKEGFNVVQVYDCMYVNNLNGCGQEWFNQHCESLIKGIAERFYQSRRP